MSPAGANPAILEAIAARAWRAAETSSHGGWRLNASAGYSGRINACWPLASPGASLDEAIAAVEAWYVARGLPPLFKIVEAAAVPPELTSRLAALGYRPRTETLMMTAPTQGAVDPEVRLTDIGDAGFAAVFAAAATGDAADARERLGALRRIPSPRAFAQLERNGRPVAIGACAVEGAWAGVFAMRTSASHRRQGFARRILGALMARAANAGAASAYLQVEADNAAALRLYQDAGFAEAYRYRYWARG